MTDLANGSILRSHRKTGYTHICNDLFDDKDLDWQHQGLLIFLLSKPDGWIIRPDYLIAQKNASGRDRVRKILSELEGLGYVRRSKARNEKGQWIWTSEVFESLELRGDNFERKIPQPKSKKSRKSAPTAASPMNGKSVDGLSVDGNSGDISTTDQETTDQEKDLITNSLTLTGEPGKSADAETDLISPETSTNLNPHEFASESKPNGLNKLEGHQNLLNKETYQSTREDAYERLIEGNESTNHSPLVVNPDPREDISAAPPRATSIDKTQTIFGKERPIARQKRQAAESSAYQVGKKNPTQRWKDLEDYKRFEAYVIEDARQRRTGEKAATPDQTYDERWINNVLMNTAKCLDEDSKFLICWKAWNQEIPTPAAWMEDAPLQPEPEIDEVERRRRVKALEEKIAAHRAQVAAKQAAERAEREARMAKCGIEN